MTIRDGACLVLQAPPEDGGQALWFRAASPPELEVWQRELGDLLAGLQSEAALARLLARERRHVICMPPFVELPHAGSRNLRERRLAKTFYLGVTPAEDQASWSSYLAAGDDATTRPPLRVLSLTRLPHAGWTATEHAAFERICRAVNEANHPFLLPAHLLVTMASRERLVSVRTFMPDGSLKDSLHGGPDPRRPYSSKYARARSRGFHVARTMEIQTETNVPELAAARMVGGDLPPPAQPAPLSLASVAAFGRQILEALRFLRAAGVPGVHVHTGNVMIDTDEISGGGDEGRLGDEWGGGARARLGI